jgi:hypothetical protein
VKNLLKSLDTIDPNIKQRIFNSMKNINLDYVFGYEKDGEKHKVIK